MTTIHNGTLTVTLSPDRPDVTIAGRVNADGRVGAYTVYAGVGPQTLEAAIFGPAAGTFTVTNDGTVLSDGSLTGLDGLPLDFGIVLGGAGTLLNTGLIEGPAGVFFGGAGRVWNSGFIDATSGIALQLPGGGVTNAAHGTIAALTVGVQDFVNARVTNAGMIVAEDLAVVVGNDAIVTNSGYIAADVGVHAGTLGMITNSGTIRASTFGVYLADGGTVVNGGRILGASAGVLGFEGTAAVTNQVGGTIEALSEAISLYAGNANNAGRLEGIIGVYLGQGGSAVNTCVIEAEYAGVQIGHGDGFVSNRGDISASTFGIVLASRVFGSFSGHDAVVNMGTIQGGQAGIAMTHGGTVTDGGTIMGGTYAISFAAGYGDRLILDPGAKLLGTVELGGGTLALAKGKQAGTIAPGGGSFTNVGEIDVGEGAVWRLAGRFESGPEAMVVNDGTIREAKADDLRIDGSLAGTGLIDMGKALTLQGAVGAGERIAFSGTSETLIIGEASGFKGRIGAFAAGDVIELPSVSYGAVLSSHFGRGVLTLAQASGDLKLTFSSPGGFGTLAPTIFHEGDAVGIRLAPTL